MDHRTNLLKHVTQGMDVTREIRGDRVHMVNNDALNIAELPLCQTKTRGGSLAFSKNPAHVTCLRCLVLMKKS